MMRAAVRGSRNRASRSSLSAIRMAPSVAPRRQCLDPDVARPFERRLARRRQRQDDGRGPHQDDCDDDAELHQCLALAGKGLAGTPATRSPAATSFVITAPAPVTAPSPIVTGAMSIVSQPIKAPAPIVVRCLLTPS